MTTATLTINPSNMSTTLSEQTLTPANSALIPGQSTLIPGESPPPTAAGGTPAVTPGVPASQAQQVLEGRFLERLLLNPQSIPEGEQRLLRQQLQQHLTSSQATDPSAARYQLVVTVLAGADGQPLINPQLLQQLEHKQAAEVAHHAYQHPVVPGADLTASDTANRSASTRLPLPNNSATHDRPIGAQQLAKTIEQALTGDSHHWQQLTQQLVAASRQEALPERHQLLVLATLLLDESDPPLTPMDPRTRRQLGRQLLSALKQGKHTEASSAHSAATRAPSAEQLASARQAISKGAVGERWSDDEEEHSLPPELLWSGLGVAPATVKLTQVEAVLDSLVDKNALELAGQGSLHAFMGRASMDQLLMVVTTLMIKVNNVSASFMVQSQKINALASGKVMENQLLKQIEEAEKAQKEQENAKKAGIFGAIFNWVVAIVATVAAVVTLNPIAMAGAVLLIAAAAVDTAQLALGSDAPAWLGKLSMGLSIAGGILSAGASVLTSVGKATISAIGSVGKTMMQQGIKAAFQQVFKGILKAVSNALKKLLAWFKSLPQAATEGLDAVKNFGRAAANKVKNPIDSLKQAGKGVAKKTTKMTENMTDPKVYTKNLPNVARGISTSLGAVEGMVGTAYTYKGEMLQAEIRKLQNDSWLLDCVLEYYQKQRKQLHQGMEDLYQQQGDATAIASDLFKESAGLQNRIAGGLA